MGCVCSFLAGHEDAGVVTGQKGTNTPKFVLKQGCGIWVGLERAEMFDLFPMLQSRRPARKQVLGPEIWERKETNEEQNISIRISQDCPGIWGDLVFLFFSPIRNDPQRTHKQNFDTRPVPGQSPKFVYVHMFFGLPRMQKIGVKKMLGSRK